MLGSLKTVSEMEMGMKVLRALLGQHRRGGGKEADWNIDQQCSHNGGLSPSRLWAGLALQRWPHGNLLSSSHSLGGAPQEGRGTQL